MIADCEPTLNTKLNEALKECETRREERVVDLKRDVAVQESLKNDSIGPEGALPKGFGRSIPKLAREVISNDPWAHRSTKMKCRTCRFFVSKEGLTVTLGRCRKHAPTMNGYPAVFVSDWCGDYKIDENKI